MGRAFVQLLLFALLGHSHAVSPVQKVVELLDECKAKVEKDLAAETTAMEEYTKFCDDELKDKGYAIETAGRSIEDLTATAEDATATAAEKADEISTLGSTYAMKSKELMDATKVREGAHEDFLATEAELVTSVDQLGRAAGLLKKGGASFAQIRGKKQKLSNVLNALKSIVEAEWVDSRHRNQLKSFLQEAKNSDSDDDLSAALLQQTQPQAKMVAYESSSGGILATVEEMQGKAEDTLADVRKEEMSASHSFASIKGGLEQELKHTEDKLSAAKGMKGSAEQLLAESNGKLTETSKSKAADEEYSATLKQECETKAAEWEARQKSASGELAAIQKAKDILISGVKAFVQVSAKTRRRNSEEQSADDESDADAERREQIVDKLKALSQEHKSYQLAQIANMASSDPFVKVRGLIEDMIAKLLKEAAEAATKEAFCQEEMGKSKTSQEQKTATAGKLTARIDKAETTIATLTEDIKTLEEEIAQIDKAQAEATSMRSSENADYKKASSDFKQSAEAVAKAIEVLKTYYEGAFIQVAQTTRAGPELGGAKSDTASTIISVLEMAEEDFTTLLAETEETESAAAKAFDTLSQENKVAKATKTTEVKAKTSEIKSLKVSLGHHKEDYDSVTAELDAVNAYIDKLKPECESKAMSYAEKKAAREAEIEGLKEALGILQGDLSLAQTGQKLRAVKQI